MARQPPNRSQECCRFEVRSILIAQIKILPVLVIWFHPAACGDDMRFLLCEYFQC